MKNFEDSAAELANRAMQFLDDWEGLIRSLVNAGGTGEDREGLNESLDELAALAKDRRRAQEQFLRAVAGAPPVSPEAAHG